MRKYEYVVVGTALVAYILLSFLIIFLGAGNPPVSASAGDARAQTLEQINTKIGELFIRFARIERQVNLVKAGVRSNIISLMRMSERMYQSDRVQYIKIECLIQDQLASLNDGIESLRMEIGDSKELVAVAP